jgi:hypothetical protein
MCQLLSRNFKQKLFRSTKEVNYLFPFNTSHIQGHKWIYSQMLQGVSVSTSFAIVETGDIKAFEGGNAWGMQNTIKASGWISPVACSTYGSCFGGRELDEMVDFAVVKVWLDFCKSNHIKTCRFIHTRKMLPIKVIDCASRKIMRANPELPERDYVALSYVWGDAHLIGAEGHSVIDDNNLPSPLPNVIEDAIIATQKMGFQYLWVDRYCIDQSNMNEKNSQIQQMDLIYSRAWCTIIAAAGCDPTAGLPGVSTIPRKPSFSVTTQHGVFVSVPPDPVTGIKDSVWNSRGWTFQEAILSRRCLVFRNDQVYFKCGGMACRDAANLPLIALHRKNPERFSAWNDTWNDSFNDTSQDNRLFRTISMVRYPYHECSKLIQSYTYRTMSKSDDILNGMFGIFQRFNSVHRPFRQFHGIIVVPDVTFVQSQVGEPELKKKEIRPSSYTEQLATGLCWDVDRSMNLHRSGARRPGFPSWSWTGWIERLTTPSEYEGYVSNTHGLKLWVEGNQCGTIDWEEFCRNNPPGNDLSTSNTAILVEATFVNVTLRHCAADPANGDETYPKGYLNWWALLEREDKSFLSTRFSLTREQDEVLPSSYEKLKSKRWPGFILGIRHGTSASPARVYSSYNTHLVLMVVDGISGVVERLGIAHFVGRAAVTNWDAELEGMATQRSCIRWR